MKNKKKNYSIFFRFFLFLVFFLLSFIHQESALRKKKKHRPGYEAMHTVQYGCMTNCSFSFSVQSRVAPTSMVVAVVNVCPHLIGVIIIITAVVIRVMKLGVNQVSTHMALYTIYSGF